PRGSCEEPRRRARDDPGAEARPTRFARCRVLSTTTFNVDVAVERISRTALMDDGYREQLVALAHSHDGIYRRALDALYEHERETLSEEEASEREARDRELLHTTREGDLARRRRRLIALARRRADRYADLLAQLVG